MSFLLDTCVLSEAVRREPSKRVVDWLDSQDEALLHVSALTIGEIEKGIEKLSDPVRRARLESWLREALIPRFGPRILSVDVSVATLWGRLSGAAERTGRPLPVIDGLLAATAAVHGLTVVTRNTVHFADCGVALIDLWS